MAQATDGVLKQVIASNKFAKARDIDEALEWGRRYHPDKDLVELLFMRGVVDRSKVALIRKLAKMVPKGASGRVARDDARREIELRETIEGPPPSASGVKAPSSTSPGGRVKVRTKEPEQVGRYEIIERVAQGGMGVIYKARHPDLDRLFAVKLLTPRSQTNAEALARFQREAKTAARLDHPNIVRVHDAGVDDGVPYLVMDFVDGPNLDGLIKEEGLGVRKAAQITRSVALALHHAHQNGVVHRDVKPENVILDRASGEPKITDFGIVKDLAEPDDAEQSKLTQTGFTLGSPCYMSPEQAEGRHDAVGPPSDVYSLAATLYEMLTSEPPFDGDSIHDIMTKVVREEAVNVAVRNPNVPPDLAVVCMKALEKESERRYPTAKAFAEDLDRFLKEEPVLAKPVGMWTRASRTIRRHKAVTGLGLLFAVVLVIGSGLFYAREVERRQEAQARLVKRLAEAQAALNQASEAGITVSEKRRLYYDALKALELILKEHPAHAAAQGQKRAVVMALGDHLIESGETSFAEFVFTIGSGVADEAVIASRIVVARSGRWVKQAERAELKNDLPQALELYKKGLRALKDAGFRGSRIQRRIKDLQASLDRRGTADQVKKLVKSAEASATKGEDGAAFLAYRQALALAPGDTYLRGRTSHYRQRADDRVQKAVAEAQVARAQVDPKQAGPSASSVSALLAQGDVALGAIPAKVAKYDYSGAKRLARKAHGLFGSAAALTLAVQARAASQSAEQSAEKGEAAKYAPRELGVAKDQQLKGEQAFTRNDFKAAREFFERAAESFRRAARTGGNKSVVASARSTCQSTRRKLLSALSPSQRTAQFKNGEADFQRAERKYDEAEYQEAKDLYNKAKAVFEAVLVLAPKIKKALSDRARVSRLRRDAQAQMALEFASNDFSVGREAELAGDAHLKGGNPVEASKSYSNAIYRYEKAHKKAKPHAIAKRDYDARVQLVMDARQVCLDEKTDWKTDFKRGEEYLKKAKASMLDRYWAGARRHLNRALRAFQGLHGTGQ